MSKQRHTGGSTPASVLFTFRLSLGAFVLALIGIWMSGGWLVYTGQMYPPAAMGASYFVLLITGLYAMIGSVLAIGLFVDRAWKYGAIATSMVIVAMVPAALIFLFN